MHPAEAYQRQLRYVSLTVRREGWESCGFAIEVPFSVSVAKVWSVFGTTYATIRISYSNPSLHGTPMKNRQKSPDRTMMNEFSFAFGVGFGMKFSVFWLLFSIPVDAIKSARYDKC